MRIEKAYHFDTNEGEKTLAELFDGRSQPVVYDLMFGTGLDRGLPGRFVLG